MNIFDNFAAIPAITIICILGSEIYKSFVQEAFYKHIPAICGILGLVLGVVSYVVIPGFIPAENWLVAAAMGAVSGWAATGLHQIVKQGGKNE